MDRAQKRELVSTLNEAWRDSGVLVVAHYAGMTVAQMTEFRKRMKEAGGAVKVAKNSLAMLALKGTASEGATGLLKGQTCVAYSPDPVSAARVSVEYSRDNDKLVILAYTFKTLSDDQRRAIYQALKDQPAGQAFNADIGVELPPAVELHPMPAEVANRVPQTKDYRYAISDNRVLLVAPINRVVVGVFPDAKAIEAGEGRRTP